MHFLSISQPDYTDIAIIGAGPHALTLVAHLLQKRQTMKDRFVVLDASGTWMQQWHQQFAALEIPHLRSPVVHHPDPNPGALRSFAEFRSQELFPPYDLPGTQWREASVRSPLAGDRDNIGCHGSAAINRSSGCLSQ